MPETKGGEYGMVFDVRQGVWMTADGTTVCAMAEYVELRRLVTTCLLLRAAKSTLTLADGSPRRLLGQAECMEVEKEATRRIARLFE